MDANKVVYVKFFLVNMEPVAEIALELPVCMRSCTHITISKIEYFHVLYRYLPEKYVT
jgi:hypothetical protein